MNEENNLIVQPTLDLDTTQDLNAALIKRFEEGRQRVIWLLRQSPSVTDAVQKLATGQTYRVVIPPEVAEQLQKGTAQWDARASGLLGVTIRDNETGRIISQASLQKVSPEIFSSLSQVAVQQTLAEIVQRLEVIDQKISDVLQGQQNDRLALIDSGIDIYQQAVVIDDPLHRSQLLTSAIRQLNEGRRSLAYALETDIRFFDEIPQRSRQRFIHLVLSRRHSPDLIASKARPVQETFQAILRSSYVLALAYEALGEQRAIRVSLQPLQEIVQRVGVKGKQIARWLPYNRHNPPEELWHRAMLQLGDGIVNTSRQLETINTKSIEVVFSPNEILEGGAK